MALIQSNPEMPIWHSQISMVPRRLIRWADLVAYVCPFLESAVMIR